MDVEAQHNAVYCELVHSVARSCGEVRLKVTGSSMLPAVRSGDEITVMRCEYTELQTGQIVLYRRGDELTAHRIERIAPDHLVARGDSLLSPDPPVLSAEIVGRVVGILRNGRSVHPEHSPLSRIVSLILRRSDLLRRITHYFVRSMDRRHGRPLRCSEEMQVS